MRMAIEEWIAKSGPLATPAHVGRVVRERLGEHLDKRREHVRAAMASAQEQDVAFGRLRPAIEKTPASGQPTLMPNPAGQSHSGIVATSPGAPRARESLPSVPGPVALPPPVPPPMRMAPAREPSQAPTSSMRYAVAAIAGVLFAMVVGGAVLAVGGHSRASRESAAAALPSVALSPPAATSPPRSPACPVAHSRSPRHRSRRRRATAPR